MQFESKIELKKVRHASPRRRMVKIVNEPQLRRQLVLAHHVERVLAEGKAKDYGQIAGWLHISHPRLIQIVTLTLLAPDIQREILLSTDEKINNLPEYKTREITNEFDWEKQRTLWQKLTNSHLSFTSNS
ncbi:MAG: hypothetical protein KKD29_03790 [Candidatus Omnitrophica bacterium]|nr:hypothetical protein [Candidatus Omnitrophota bacterium]